MHFLRGGAVSASDSAALVEVSAAPEGLRPFGTASVGSRLDVGPV
jgi:hypothetical protein